MDATEVLFTGWIRIMHPIILFSQKVLLTHFAKAQVLIYKQKVKEGTKQKPSTYTTLLLILMFKALRQA